MAKPRAARLQELLGILNQLYPPGLAEDWDNVGLQIGDPQAELERILVCLDPSEAALDAALERGATALVSHHPLIFRPLRQLSNADATGRRLLRAARHGIAVLSVHTNLDRGRDGLNDWLAERFELQQVAPLAAGQDPLVKLVVFVPSEHATTVADALFQAGAGSIGNYDRCSFRVAGTGTFRPGAGTSPFIGQAGQTEEVTEIRLETIVPEQRLNKVVAKLLKAHPYEEVAYDLIPLQNRSGATGLGRIGRLPAPDTLAEFVTLVKSRLELTQLRYCGDPAAPIAKVAVCGGSGATLLSEAARQGADVLVTGDVKYHEALQARELGVALVDAGHHGTERIMVPQLARRLAQQLQERNFSSQVDTFEDRDPFYSA